MQRQLSSEKPHILDTAQPRTCITEWVFIRARSVRWFWEVYSATRDKLSQFINDWKSGIPIYQWLIKWDPNLSMIDKVGSHLFNDWNLGTWKINLLKQSWIKFASKSEMFSFPKNISFSRKNRFWDLFRLQRLISNHGATAEKKTISGGRSNLCYGESSLLLLYC